MKRIPCAARSALRRSIPSALFAALLSTSPIVAEAETADLRIASGFGIHYLPFYVMQREHLVEQAAKELGIPDLKVEYKLLSGGAAYNDALLTGDVDAIGSGLGPFAILWDRTRGHQNVRALAAMGDIPFVLLSNEQSIKELRDITSMDRIAVPAVKASIQATLLQIAAAKQFGADAYGSLDDNTVSMTHADATTALLSGQGIVDLHFSVPPYSTRELQRAGVHQVTDSEEIIGGPMSANLVSMTQKFHDDNPKISEALLRALTRAMVFINTDRRAAAQIYFAESKGAATSISMVDRILADPRFNFTVVPHGVSSVVTFMHSVGVIRNNPQSWRDMFFPESASVPGN